MHYVYLIQSLSHPTHRYIGLTDNLPARLSTHNAGKVASTSRHNPWRLLAYTAFTEAPQAAAFERYLKSGSGHAFAVRHLW